MAQQQGAGAAEDVNDFLVRIRELGNKRDKEDEERTKKLEEEILQGRREREARRAERARSISPTKDSPLAMGSPAQRQSVISTSSSRNSVVPPIDFLPTSKTLDLDLVSFPTTTNDKDLETKNSPEKGSDSPGDATAVRRSRTMSWKQRPGSRDLNASRPSSGLSGDKPGIQSDETRVEHATTSETDSTPSRTQIAESLGSKDPAWFRQTADRGVGSAAYRKTPNYSSPDAHSSAGGIKLPGLGKEKESPQDPEKASNYDDSERSRSPSRASSIYGTSSLGNRYSSISSVSTPGGGLGSPIPLSSPHRLEPRISTNADASQVDKVAMSPSQGRLTSNRPSSPTKGMGGFVQSAMMKRSDSVSKRWSQQSGPGNFRNSVTSSSKFNPQSPRVLGEGNDNSGLTTSRPGSSHSEATVVRQPANSQGTGNSDSGNGRPGSSAANDYPRRPSIASRPGSVNPLERESSDIPITPSKTMDQKRWSPTKASWLESALNKPDSPKARPRTPQEPEWKKDLTSKLRHSKVPVSPDKKEDARTVTGLEKSSPETKFPAPPESRTEQRKNEENGIRSPGDPKSNSSHVDDVTKKSSPVTSPSIPPKNHDLGSKVKTSAKGTNDIPPSPSEGRSSSPEKKSAVDIGSPKSSSPKPPLNGFRANLRRRDTLEDKAGSKEPEFKAVFGKLRKAETKNYVAPDEFKGNILRGKAALSVTGGPKKTERVDEFKESILQRKEAMKAGGGSIRRGTMEDKNTPPLPQGIPEAIAKRNALGRSDSMKSSISSINTTPLSPKPLHTRSQTGSSGTAGVISPLKTHRTSPSKQLDEKDSASPPPTTISPVKIREESKPNEKVQPLSSPSPPPSTLPTTSPPLASPGNLRTGQGKLANRLNPALAGILARGPPPPPESKGSSGSLPSTTSVSESTTSAGNLTHMTKARAKGPKRRAPKAAKPEVAKPETPSSESRQVEAKANAPAKEPLQQIKSLPLEEIPQLPKLKSPASPPTGRNPEFIKKLQAMNMKHDQAKEDSFGLPKTDIIPESGSAADKQETLEFLPATRYSPSKPTLSPFTNAMHDSVSSPKDKPSLPPKSITLPVNPLSTSNQEKPPKPESFASPKESVTTPKDKPSPPAKSINLPKNRITAENQEKPPKPGPVTSPKDTVTSPSDKPSPPPKSINLPKNPIFAGSQDKDSKPLPTERPSIDSVSNSPLSTPGEAPSSVPSRKPSPLPGTAQASPEKRVVSPPVPPKTATVSAIKPSRPVSHVTPFPQASEASQLFSGFFSTPPSAKNKAEIDPQSVLSSKSGKSPKSKTLKKQIWEFSGDGRKKDLPPNQEYILFEENMYFCTHTFESADGTKTTQAHLWCGDDVSDATVEDAQLFARKLARENNCKLDIMKQGKETAHFIQALGGIMITRRGSSSRAHSSSLYMLRGRRHLGQISFDEVDLSPKSLCSGYLYIISSRLGKLYLWKGRGSTADELGCARLIGMDLGLTGEIEEIVEGQEPDEFFNSFPDLSQDRIYPSDDHWRFKSSNENYCCRLFRIEHGLGQRFGAFWNRRGAGSPVSRFNETLQEIEPFCQRDLDPGHVYVLDTFFEIYVIVGEQANSRSVEFASALIFAQEYGFLAVSEQDRPFLPKGTVVLHGLPDECKRAFRKWNDRASSGHNNPAKIIPLSAAIEAIR